MVEAYRLLHGLPVYTDVEQGHATAMFGPLSVVWIAIATLLAGPHFWAMPVSVIGRW